MAGENQKTGFALKGCELEKNYCNSTEDLKNIKFVLFDCLGRNNSYVTITAPLKKSLIQHLLQFIKNT